MEKENKPKKLFGGGWRRPRREEKDGPLWCNCLIPNLTHGAPRGNAWCLRCKTPYYH
jgi:hypothetical protein